MTRNQILVFSLNRERHNATVIFKKNTNAIFSINKHFKIRSLKITIYLNSNYKIYKIKITIDITKLILEIELSKLVSFILNNYC